MIRFLILAAVVTLTACPRPAPNDSSAACHQDSDCAAVDGVAQVCVDQRCQPPSCPGTQCNTPGAALAVLSADARACDVVLVDDDAIKSVDFRDGVQGRTFRKGGRLAVSFIAAGDAVPAAGSVQLELRDGAALEAVQLELAECFGRDGALLSGMQVALR